MKNKKTNLSKYEWIGFASAYLALARIGIEELSGKKYPNKKHPFENLLVYESNALLVPIVWNFKHAIEIIIKSLGIAINKEYIETHNQHQLTAELKKKIKDLDITKRYKMDEFSNLIYKYYRCEFFGNKIISHSTVLDVNNDIFRYPDNSATFVLDVKMFSLVSKEEIAELLEDINSVYKLFHILNSQISKKKIVA